MMNRFSTTRTVTKANLLTRDEKGKLIVKRVKSTDTGAGAKSISDAAVITAAAAAMALKTNLKSLLNASKKKKMKKTELIKGESFSSGELYYDDDSDNSSSSSNDDDNDWHRMSFNDASNPVFLHRHESLISIFHDNDDISDFHLRFSNSRNKSKGGSSLTSIDEEQLKQLEDSVESLDDNSTLLRDAKKYYERHLTLAKSMGSIVCEVQKEESRKFLIDQLQNALGRSYNIFDDDDECCITHAILSSSERLSNSVLDNNQEQHSFHYEDNCEYHDYLYEIMTEAMMNEDINNSSSNSLNTKEEEVFKDRKDLYKRYIKKIASNLRSASLRLSLGILEQTRTNKIIEAEEKKKEEEELSLKSSDLFISVRGSYSYRKDKSRRRLEKEEERRASLHPDTNKYYVRKSTTMQPSNNEKDNFNPHGDKKSTTTKSQIMYNESILVDDPIFHRLLLQYDDGVISSHSHNNGDQSNVVPNVIDTRRKTTATTKTAANETDIFLQEANSLTKWINDDEDDNTSSTSIVSNITAGTEAKDLIVKEMIKNKKRSYRKINILDCQLTTQEKEMKRSLHRKKEQEDDRNVGGRYQQLVLENYELEQKLSRLKQVQAETTMAYNESIENITKMKLKTRSHMQIREKKGDIIKQRNIKVVKKIKKLMESIKVLEQQQQQGEQGIIAAVVAKTAKI